MVRSETRGAGQSLTPGSVFGWPGRQWLSHGFAQDQLMNLLPG